MQYAVTLDVLQTVFSAYGFVQKIAMFDKNGGLHALIQYPEVQTATAAKVLALEGHGIYDGGFCKLHLAFSRHTDLSIEWQINGELMGVIESLTSKFEKEEKQDKACQEESCDTWEKDADVDHNVDEHKNEDTSRGDEEKNVSDPMETENKLVASTSNGNRKRKNTTIITTTVDQESGKALKEAEDGNDSPSSPL